MSRAGRFVALAFVPASVCAILTLAVLPEPVLAVPSYSRQAGVECNTCHTVFPQLTPFGRDFKRHGYTFSTEDVDDTSRLQLVRLPPIAAMVQTSYTHLNDGLPSAQNDDIALPDQLSLFLAGGVSDFLGLFTQLTYDGVDDHFTMDNTDIRAAFGASQGETGLVYGISVNNSPTVQDLWNSTPAWGYPYASSSVAPGPAAATQIDGTLGQQVVGVDAYASWSDWIHAEMAVYRTFQVGETFPPDSGNEDVIHGVAPYWRVAAFHDWGSSSVEVGTYGLSARLYPGGGTPLEGPTDGYLDVAGDAQYQWLGDLHTVTLHATGIWERQDLDASFGAGDASNRSNHLATLRADGTYYYNRLVGGTVAFFRTMGSRDQGVYAPGAVDGSRTGEPDSTGLIFELDYAPWYNTKFMAQYLLYTQFNGASSNYDGSGRSAGDNSSLYLNAWIMF